MSEKARFHSMTRPVRFRKLKQAKMMIVLWCKAVRERIIYLFNYVLYKLNILKRYSYRDNSVQVLPLPHQVLIKKVESSNFMGNVVMTLLLSTDIDVDYFYREKKNGEKKVTMYLKNHEESRLFTESHLDNIWIKIDKWYNVNALPIFKVAFLEDQRLEPSDPTQPLKRPDYETRTYNIEVLKKLTHKSLLGVNMKPKDISEPMLHYYYNFSVGEFKKYLNNLSLQDLLM